MTEGVLFVLRAAKRFMQCFVRPCRILQRICGAGDAVDVSAPLVAPGDIATAVPRAFKSAKTDRSFRHSAAAASWPRGREPAARAQG